MNWSTKIQGILRKLANKQLDAISFASALDELSISMQNGTEEIIAETMVELWQAIVDKTPVDLGLAAANWQIGPKKNTTILYKEILDKKLEGGFHLYSGRQIPPPVPPSVSSLKGHDVVHIFNNVPYIEELERGSSPQTAPNAMIADNIQKFKSTLESRLKNTGVFR